MVQFTTTIFFIKEALVRQFYKGPEHEHGKASFISSCSLLLYDSISTFSINTYIKIKLDSRDKSCPKNGNLPVWHDVPPAGRWVEWAEVKSGWVQVRGQRGGNEWRQAAVSAASLWHCLATCQAQFAACQAAARDGTGRRWAQTWRRGLGRVRRKYERQMNWCMQIYVSSGGRYYWDFTGHMIFLHRT